MNARTRRKRAILRDRRQGMPDMHQWAKYADDRRCTLALRSAAWAGTIARGIFNDADPFEVISGLELRDNAGTFDFRPGGYMDFLFQQYGAPLEPDWTEEPANIPVRRQVEGRWQTVMITRSEWDAAEGAR